LALGLRIVCHSGWTTINNGSKVLGEQCCMCDCVLPLSFQLPLGQRYWVVKRYCGNMVYVIVPLVRYVSFLKWFDIFLNLNWNLCHKLGVIHELYVIEI
jgi:hypothetical protein